MSQRILFCNWRFHDGEIEVQRPALKGPVYTQSKTETYRHGPAAIEYPDGMDDFGNGSSLLTHERWELVTLPHDYMVNSPIDENENNALGFRKYHPAWYRKHFKAADDWCGKRVELEFLGIATECDIYFNGVWLKHNETQYTPIIVDITDFIRYGGADNVIAVHVTQRTIENWWYNGGGICHKAYINVSSPVSVERDGVYIAPKKLGGDNWEIPITVEVHNDAYSAANAFVECEVLDADGCVIAITSSELAIDARSLSVAAMPKSVVAAPRLWDIDDPYLHTVRTRVSVNGKITDERTDRFGFRTVEFTVDRGFLLNGKRRYINGICGHEDFSLTGKAVADNVMRHKARMLKEMGVNAYRCAHSMQDEAYMDAFDELGIMVMAETRHFSTAQTHLDELRALVRRDRNRPSVFMWSVGNEEHYFITDQGRRIAEKMTFEVKRLDSTRPVMTANDKKPEICTVYDTSDLVAVNYNHDLYDYLHEKFPGKPIFASEFAAASTTRAWYFDDRHELGRMSAYDSDINQWFISHEHAFRYLYDRPFMMGGFVWSAFEYLGEAKWPRISSCSGAIDIALQRKDAFYQLKSFFSDEPMIHVMPHWNMEGRKNIRIVAYTNLAFAEVFINGRSLGKQACEKYIANEWRADFEAGELRAVGYDKDGNKVAEDVKVTTGAPYGLKLHLDNEGDVCANNEDLALFTCTVVDAEGREVPDAECEVTFISDKGVRFVGSASDNTDHIPPKSATRRIYSGRALAAFVPAAPGEMTVYATCQGLKTAAISVNIPENKKFEEGRVYSAINVKW